MVSQYVIGEVVRNVRGPGHDERLSALLARTTIVSDADIRMIPANVSLVAKDVPILAAAIAASVDYLITGDKAHFAHLYGRKILHVSVISPAEFFDLHKERLVR